MNNSVLKIDKYALDVEAERIPSQIQEYGELRNEKEAEKDRLYALYKVTKNEKNLYYRKNPPADIKVTESVIESLVEVDPQVREAHVVFLQAQEEFGTYDVFYQALRDKSSKVRDLINLFGMGYFAPAGKKAKNSEDFNTVDE
jgi:hypothetical protein